MEELRPDKARLKGESVEPTASVEPTTPGVPGRSDSIPAMLSKSTEYSSPSGPASAKGTQTASTQA